MPRPLGEYQQKRDFERTREPQGATAGSRPAPNERDGERIFVVHRHEATHLHYDLRLRMQGTLKCWAVPRGFSYVPTDKRLAQRTEDHPMEYERFSGVIPRGEYGAGTMEIWDQGTYQLLNRDGDAGLEAGKLELVLTGRRLHGEWHLVKTQQHAGSWLLFKARDAYARGSEDPPYPLALGLEAAEAGTPDLRGAPMRPARGVAPFSDPAWLFEVEFEGLRVRALKDGDEIQLRARGKRLDTSAPWAVQLVAELRRVRARGALLDGVLVAPDAQGRPSEDELARILSRAADERGDDAPSAHLRGDNGRGEGVPGEDSERSGRGDPRVVLYAFDLLHYDAWRLAALPLGERKQLLSALLPAGGRHVLYVDHVVGEGERLATVVAASGLPGVIAKRADSSYRKGAAGAWLRVEVPRAEAQDRPVLESIAAAAGPRRASRVRVTNREKIYWPQAGITKGEFVDYYDRVAEFLLPYLHDRPLHMYRFPDGIEGKSFYHHDAPEHTPDWVQTFTPADHAPDAKRVRYIVCNDRDTLLYLANLGSIDLHAWMSRCTTPDTPDWLVIDLDPDGSPFAQVVRVARAVGKLLRGIGVQAFPKTSGASGLHLGIPLRPIYTYEQVRQFGEMLARYVAREHPDLCTVERSVARRQGRVYIDTLQNHRGQTVVPPYVVRPVPAASVSTPLDWDELSVDLDPAAFNVRTLPDRLARVGDLFRGTLQGTQELLGPLENFQREYLGRGD